MPKRRPQPRVPHKAADAKRGLCGRSGILSSWSGRYRHRSVNDLQRAIEECTAKSELQKHQQSGKQMPLVDRRSRRLSDMIFRQANGTSRPVYWGEVTECLASRWRCGQSTPRVLLHECIVRTAPQDRRGATLEARRAPKAPPCPMPWPAPISCAPTSFQSQKRRVAHDRIYDDRKGDRRHRTDSRHIIASVTTMPPR